jgi:hypothetical protein
VTRSPPASPPASPPPGRRPAISTASYGDISDLDELARRLADRDHGGNIARIVAGATLDDLRA